MLDDLRFLKTKYRLNLSNIRVFSKFLKGAEESGLKRTEIINCMHILTRLGIASAKSPVFNLFIDLVKYIRRNKLEITHLGSILKSKKEVFLDGYKKCIEDSEKIIIDSLPPSIDVAKTISITKLIQGMLLLNLHAISLTVK